MIIMTGSTSNGDGDLPATASEDDEQRQQHQHHHRIELVRYAVRNGSVSEDGDDGGGTSLELSPVDEPGLADDGEEVDDTNGDSAEAETDQQQQLVVNGGRYQVELEEPYASDEDDSLHADGKLRNLISFCKGIVGRNRYQFFPLARSLQVARKFQPAYFRTRGRYQNQEPKKNPTPSPLKKRKRTRIYDNGNWRQQKIDPGVAAGVLLVKVKCWFRHTEGNHFRAFLGERSSEDKANSEPKFGTGV
uniref:Uncharacterized protein n=1 Tax=Anopheles farauti TaxID=69004 RepID=A0A182QX09_9DIPT